MCCIIAFLLLWNKFEEEVLLITSFTVVWLTWGWPLLTQIGVYLLANKILKVIPIRINWYEYSACSICPSISKLYFCFTDSLDMSRLLSQQCWRSLRCPRSKLCSNSQWKMICAEVCLKSSSAEEGDHGFLLKMGDSQTHFLLFGNLEFRIHIEIVWGRGPFPYLVWISPFLCLNLQTQVS